MLTGFETAGIQERYRIDGNETLRKTVMGVPRQEPMEPMLRD
jgi:hypothetical protein